MNKTMRKERPTYTDKLLSATTWTEVLELDERTFFTPTYVGATLERMPNIEYEPEDPEARKAFEELSDIIDNLLTEKELKVWSAVVDEKLSYRKIGDDMGISYETARKIFIVARLKIQEAVTELKNG